MPGKKKHSPKTISSIVKPAAQIVLATSILAVIFLASLHILSPEFDPAFRAVSDYALGEYDWVLSLMFYSWAISSFALAIAIHGQLKSIRGRIGLFFLVLAGIGELAGGLFNVTQPPHGLAFFIGVPCLPIAAVLISHTLSKMKPWATAKTNLKFTAHATWISILILIATIAIMVQGVMHAGVTPGPQMTELPEGVIALFGWANRLLVMLYCLWVATTAYYAIKLRNK